MSIFKKDTIIKSWPALDIVEREADRDGFVNITVDDILGCPRQTRHGELHTEFSPGSVVSYALRYNEDPIAAVEQAKARGHELHWINGRGSVLRNTKRERYSVVQVLPGMKVRFEGLLATIERAPNDNLRFVPIKD